MFLVARLLLGMGIPFCISGASQLIAELAYPTEAAVLNGLFNESWVGALLCHEPGLCPFFSVARHDADFVQQYVGAIIAAGTTLGTFSIPNDWSWRTPSLVQIAPSVLQLIFIWFVPESPRWLLSKDRDEEAFQILVKYHAEGNRDDPFVNAEFVEIKTQVRREVENSKRRWVELLQTPGNRKRTFIAACVGLFSQWSGNGLVSYYLAKVLATVNITDKRTQNIINLALTVSFPSENKFSPLSHYPAPCCPFNTSHG